MSCRSNQSGVLFGHAVEIICHDNFHDQFPCTEGTGFKREMLSLYPGFWSTSD